MKKLYALIFGLFITTGSFGQEFSGGLKAGLNVSTIGGDSQGVESRIGFHAGLFGLIKPTDQFGFQPELVFSRQGAQSEIDSDVKLNYDYINIPLMLNYYLIEQFYIQGGPQLGILVQGEITDGTNDQDVKDQLNTADIGLAFGAGFTSGQGMVEARYVLGISDTAEDSPGSEKFPNRVFQISIGFKF